MVEGESVTVAWKYEGRVHPCDPFFVPPSIATTNKKSPEQRTWGNTN